MMPILVLPEISCACLLRLVELKMDLDVLYNTGGIEVPASPSTRPRSRNATMVVKSGIIHAATTIASIKEATAQPRTQSATDGYVHHWTMLVSTSIPTGCKRATVT